MPALTGEDKSRTRIEFAPSAAPAPAPQAKPNLSATMVMPDAPPHASPLASTAVAQPPAHVAQPPAHVAQPPAQSDPSTTVADTKAPELPRLATDKRTMIGLSAADVFGGAPPPAPSAAPAPPESLAASAKKTMMGVAMPGIAPIHPGQAQQPPASLASKSNTMLGVAMPGIAPVHPGVAPAPAVSQRPRPAPPPVDIVPAPPPLVHSEIAPAAPVVARKRGVPIAIVASVLGVLLLGGALLIVFFARSAPPLSAKPELDGEGKEVLRLRCEGCADATKVSFNGASAAFTAHEAILPLKLPLHVGDNAIELKLDRPGMGRDETVKLVVPVQFRIHADLGTIDGPKPSITVRVEALAGTDVRVDDKPLALDASGTGAYAIDLSADADGQSDERRIKKEVPYVITPKGGQPQKGNVTAQVTILPLRVDSPGTHAIVDTPSFVVAGRAFKGSTVTVNGQAAQVGPDGFFEATVASPSPGDVAVEVRTSAPGLVARTVKLGVKRVDKLDA